MASVTLKPTPGRGDTVTFGAGRNGWAAGEPRIAANIAQPPTSGAIPRLWSIASAGLAREPLGQYRQNLRRFVARFVDRPNAIFLSTSNLFGFGWSLAPPSFS